MLQASTKGINKILEKVGEEGVETIIAAKDYAAQNTESNLNDLIYETADLWFHSIVMLGYFDLNPQLIIDELGRRQGLSGLVEKLTAIRFKITQCRISKT